MNDFPDFMKNEKNRVSSSQQNTDGVEGYFYEGRDKTQMAFWTCRSAQVSKAHRHDFDEYMVCISGQYTAILEGREIVLKKGDELFIPAGTLQSGRCRAGTRTIHAFGGERIKNP